MTMSILRRLFGRIFGAFFADFFFDFAAPFAREPRPEKTVEQVTEEENGRHPLVKHRRENKKQADHKKTRDRFLRFPINRLETGILESAEHHERKEKEQRRQNEFPFAKMMFAFGQPEQKQGDRRDQAGGGGNRETGEVFSAIGASFSFMICRYGIEARETERAARQVNESDNPT